MKVAFTIPGPPIPWQRRAHYKGRFITPSKMREYKKQVAKCASLAMLHVPLIESECQARMVFYLPDRRHRDCDNLAKSILDGCNKIVYDDDWLVHKLEVLKCYDKANPRAEVEVCCAT